MSAEHEPVRVEAAAYQPYARSDERTRIRPLTIAIVLLSLLALAILIYLFTARSVTFRFSAPPDSVRIDGGAAFELGDVYLLREGEYTVHAEAPGYEPLTMDISITDARQQEVVVNFTPLPGIVSFALEPADAEVLIDGQVQDTSASARIAAGEHEVTAQHPRYRSKTILFDVAGREQAQTLSLTLAPNWGDVYINSNPEGASVLVDGQDTGLITPATVEVLAGEREIAVRRDGYRTARMRLVVAAEQEERLDTFTLVQADATLEVSTSPAGAGITVDGEFVGQSPVQLTLRSGARYRVEAILEGYHRAQQQVALKRGSNPAMQLELARVLGEVNVEAQPAGAQLRLNGRLLGDANRTLNLPTGAHEFVIELPGYAAYKTTVRPRAGVAQALRVKLLTVEEARRRALKPRYTTEHGQQMVLIEPAPITLGASRREPGRRANETLRDVALNSLFYISRHEVTNAQYKAYLASHDSGDFQGNVLNADDQPVVDVGWIDAALYCNWLSQQEQRTPVYDIDLGKLVGVNLAATGYRLPSEAEWAWVARTVPGIDSLLRYPWGDNLPPPDRHGNYADRAAQHLVGRIIYGYNDNYVATAPVGSFSANAHDLFDLGGNVAEWVHDYYEIPRKDAPAQPFGPAAGEFHVIKGSGWMHGTVTDLRLSFRDYGTDGRKDLGFRIARNAE